MNILVCAVGFTLEHQAEPERGSCLLQGFKERGTTGSVTEDLSDFQHTLQEHAKLEVVLAQTLQDDAKIEVALAQRRTAGQPNVPQQASMDNSVNGKFVRASNWFWGDPKHDGKPRETAANVHSWDNKTAWTNTTNSSSPATALTTPLPSSQNATAAPSSAGTVTTQAPSSQNGTESPSPTAAVTTQAPSSQSTTVASTAAVATQAPSSQSATEVPSSAAAVTTQAPSS